MAEEQRILKLSAGNRGFEDALFIVNAVANTQALGGNVSLERFLITPRHEAVRLRIRTATRVACKVMGLTAALAMADIELTRLSAADPRDLSPMEFTLRQTLVDVLGEAGLAEEDARQVYAGTLRKMGGVAVISSASSMALDRTTGFYEDMRTLGLATD